jgi:hypothetical protein
MGIFVGLIVHKLLKSQRRYEQVINEVYQLLLLHTDEVQVKLHSNKFIQIQAVYGSDSALLPISVHYLHTQFFRVFNGSNPPEDVKQFGAVLWECLNVFKEHYPSHIELTCEGLDRCEPFYREISNQEVLRRQVSCLSSRTDDLSVLFDEEMEDLWFVLYNTVKIYDIKSMIIILELLASNQQAPPAVFKAVKSEDLRLMMTIRSESDENINAKLYPGLTEKAKFLSLQVLKKVALKYPEKLQACEGFEQLVSESKSIEKVTKYDLPCSISALLFQLTETTSLERVNFLLHSLNHAGNVEELLKLRWAEKLKVVLDKYCEKLFTCDNLEVMKYGVFHFNFLQAVIQLSKSSENFVLILNLGYLNNFNELVEEGFRLFYQLVIHKDETEESKLEKFLSQSLKLLELVINPGYYKFLRLAAEGFTKIMKTISSFTHHSIEETAMPAPDDPEELKLLSPELFDYKSKIMNSLTKIEALLEYQERHEEKFQRLFENDD